jgi:hypothetical protein
MKPVFLASRAVASLEDQSQRKPCQAGSKSYHYIIRGQYNDNRLSSSLTLSRQLIYPGILDTLALLALPHPFVIHIANFELVVLKNNTIEHPDWS